MARTKASATADKALPTRITAVAFSKMLAKEVQREGLRRTALRCNIPHTSMAGYIHRPAQLRAEIMDALASKLGFEIMVARQG